MLRSVLVVIVLTTTPGCTSMLPEKIADPIMPQPSFISPIPARVIPAADYSVEHCGVRTAEAGKPSNVLLTIDDFPAERGKASGEKMLHIADWARSQGIMMEAFPIKSKLDDYSEAHHVDLVAELRQRGTYVSNHSYTHPQLTKLNEAEANSEIEQGVESTYLRPPYGAFNAHVKDAAEAKGYRVCTWTLDTNDWRLQSGRHPSSAELIQRVHDQLIKMTPGTPVVILGHYFTNYPLALQGILDEVRRMGMHVCEAPNSPVTSEAPFPIC